jgi:hypothetical protein
MIRKPSFSFPLSKYNILDYKQQKTNPARYCLNSFYISNKYFNKVLSFSFLVCDTKITKMYQESTPLLNYLQVKSMFKNSLVTLGVLYDK